MRTKIGIWCLAGMLIATSLVGMLMAIPAPVQAWTDTTGWESLSSGADSDDFQVWNADPANASVHDHAGDILSNRSETDSIAEVDSNNWVDTNPGYLWIEATDDTDDTFGVSTVYVDMGTPTEIHDFYYLRVQARMLVSDIYPDLGDASLQFLQTKCGIKLGWSFGAYGSAIPTAGDTWGDINEITGTGWWTSAQMINDGEGISKPAGAWAGLRFGYFDEHPGYGRPFNHTEILGMRIYLSWFWPPSFFDFLAYYDQPPVRICIFQLYGEVLGVDYAEAATPEGSFILRPDGVRPGCDGWVNNSSADDTDLWATLDETTYRSDFDTTMIYQDPLEEQNDWLGLTFTDTPSWAADVGYNCTVWLMIRASDGVFSTFEEEIVTLRVNVYGGAIFTYWQYTMWGYWWNMTQDHNENLTLEELDQLQLSVESELLSGATLNISQIGILCIPTSDVDAAPGTGEDADALLAWFATGGIPIVFGVIGAGIMVGVPALGIASYKSGGTGAMSAFLSTLMLWLLGAGFFLVGIYAS